MTQESSQILCSVVGSEEVKSCLCDDNFICLIQCFLDPALMQKHPDGKTKDPLYQFFRGKTIGNVQYTELGLFYKQVYLLLN